MLFDRRGSQTIEYVVILAAGATLAMILQSAVDSKEIKGALMQKIEQAMSLDGSTTSEGKDRTDDSPGLIARGVDSVKNGWNRLTGSSPNSTNHPKIQRTMNMDVLGNGGFGGPRGGGPRGAGGHVDNGGGYGYRGDGGNGSAKSGGNAKEQPSIVQRFTGWLDNKWNGFTNKWNNFTKRFKGGGGSNTGGNKPPNNKGDKSKKEKPKAGSKEHKEQRWKEYKERGGEWSYENWSKNYESNMGRAKKSSSYVDKYRDKIGWGEREVRVKVDGETRVLDIADKTRRRAIEHKTTTKKEGRGYFSLKPDIKWEVRRDAKLVEKGWDITWVFEKSDASKPLIEALRRAGIKVKFIERGGK
ncbi:hypothetical protein HMPREF9374_1488 [Desmospora sp. 8437]|nr:hypothetical protein HMPREF9374_1488 [Desmospora sp. 8437]